MLNDKGEKNILWNIQVGHLFKKIISKIFPRGILSKLKFYTEAEAFVKL